MSFQISKFQKGTCIKFHIYFSWLLGIIFGILFALQFDRAHSLFKHSIVQNQVSIVGTVLVHIFPFLIISLITRFQNIYLTALFLFIKAFLYSTVSNLILLAFIEADGLIPYLLILSDTIISTYLLYFSAQATNNKKPNFFSTVLFVSSACLFDYYIISPYIGSVFI